MEVLRIYYNVGFIELCDAIVTCKPLKKMKSEIVKTLILRLDFHRWWKHLFTETLGIQKEQCNSFLGWNMLMNKKNITLENIINSLEKKNITLEEAFRSKDIPDSIFHMLEIKLTYKIFHDKDEDLEKYPLVYKSIEMKKKWIRGEIGDEELLELSNEISREFITFSRSFSNGDINSTEYFLFLFSSSLSSTERTILLEDSGCLEWQRKTLLILLRLYLWSGERIFMFFDNDELFDSFS